MKSSKSRMETDQCKLGSIQKYLEEYHYPHRNNHVINTATVKPQKKHWIILWSSLNLRYSLKISPMFNLKWNLFFKGFCKSDKRMPFDIIVFLRSYALTILSCKSDCKSSILSKSSLNSIPHPPENNLQGFSLLYFFFFKYLYTFLSLLPLTLCFFQCQSLKQLPVTCCSQLQLFSWFSTRKSQDPSWQTQISP